MAEVLDYFPRPKTRRYPWDQWLNGQVWLLSRGVDYERETEKFRQQIYMASYFRGLKVQTSVDGDMIILQSRTR